MDEATKQFYLTARSCRDLGCYSATLGPFCFYHANLRHELRHEPVHPAFSVHERVEAQVAMAEARTFIGRRTLLVDNPGSAE